MNDPNDLRAWSRASLLILARAAGIAWFSSNGADPMDLLDRRERQLLDRAASGYLVRRQVKGLTVTTDTGRTGTVVSDPYWGAGSLRVKVRMDDTHRIRGIRTATLGEVR